MKNIILMILLVITSCSSSQVESQEKRLRVIVIDTHIPQDYLLKDFMCKDSVYYTKELKNISNSNQNTHAKDIVDIVSYRMDSKKYCITLISWYYNGMQDSSASLLEALQMAKKLKPSIINLSLSGRGYVDEEFQLLKVMLNNKIRINVASGNDGEVLTQQDCYIFPTCYYDKLDDSQRKFFTSVTSINLKSSNVGFGVNTSRNGYGLNGLYGTSQAVAWFTNEMVRKDD